MAKLQKMMKLVLHKANTGEHYIVHVQFDITCNYDCSCTGRFGYCTTASTSKYMWCTACNGWHWYN